MSSCQIESTTRPASGCEETRSGRPARSRPTSVLPRVGSGETVTGTVCGTPEAARHPDAEMRQRAHYSPPVGLLRTLGRRAVLGAQDDVDGLVRVVGEVQQVDVGGRDGAARGAGLTQP